MYIPKNIRMTDDHTVAEFISEFGFGTLVSSDLQATKVPFLYDTTTQGKVYLKGHMAKANPQWRDLSGKDVSVLFDGPHSYISPTWYASTPAVSTWNYASVQCFGVFEELSDTDTVEVIHQLIEKYEPEIQGNDKLLPKEYMQQLLKAVVGFKIDVHKIDGVEKLGQQKSPKDQQNVFNALKNAKQTDSLQLAEYMKKRTLGTGQL